jgi:hypothetical protein
MPFVLLGRLRYRAESKVETEKIQTREVIEC